MNKFSALWKLSKDELQELADKCATKTEILYKLGLKKGSYKTLRKRIIEDCINIEHINKNKTKLAREARGIIPLKDILVEHSKYKSIATLKKRLVYDGMLKNQCFECGLESIWKNKSLCLQLDHINGINDDHSIENLRLLCPNCHSQTINYAGRNNNFTKRSTLKICCDCGIKI